MSNPIKLVLFDVGGVLLDADLDRYIQIGCAMFETNPEALQREVGRLVPGLEKGLLSSEQFWKEIGESLWRSGEGRPAFGTSFSGIWADIMRSSLELDPKVVRIAQAVKDIRGKEIHHHHHVQQNTHLQQQYATVLQRNGYIHPPYHVLNYY